MNVIRSELALYRLYCVREVDIYIVRTKFKERLRLRGYSNSYLDQIFEPTLDRQQKTKFLKRSTPKRVCIQNQYDYA